MLRHGNTRPFHWADKTMSVLRADQLEACEKELAGLPPFCLFDAGCQDQHAEEIYDLSYYAAEDRSSGAIPSLHTVNELRIRVLASFAPETALIPSEEHDMLVRLVLFGGRMALQDWNELIPARSMIRRLWCRGEWKENTLILHMPQQLCAAALILLAGEEHKKIRDIVEQVTDSIDNTLYLYGMMQAAGPARHILSLLKGTCAEGRFDLVHRLLSASFDYVYDRSGNLTLIHPGLADPEKMIAMMSAPSVSESFRDFSPDMMSGASVSVMDLESPLYDQMLSSIMGSVRPELTPEDAVEDLIILAKQGVSLKDMSEVLTSMLVSIPTPDMLKCLENLQRQIPRWVYFSSSRVQ